MSNVQSLFFFLSYWNSLLKLKFKVILSFLELIKNVFKCSLWSNIDLSINKFVIYNIDIYSWLSRCGSGTGFSLVDSTKVKAHKSFLFIGISLELEIIYFWSLESLILVGRGYLGLRYHCYALQTITIKSLNPCTPKLSPSIRVIFDSFVCHSGVIWGFFLSLLIIPKCLMLLKLMYSSELFECLTILNYNFKNK